MTYSRIGAFNLPLEIWQDIFTTTTRPQYGSIDKKELWVSFSEYTVLSCGPPQALRDLSEYDQSISLKTRHSIVLVCKSWYFMGISMLWSHVRINLGNTNGVVAHLQDTIKHNHALASYVIRLSIRVPSLAIPVNPPSSTRDIGLLTTGESHNSHIIKSIMPYLTHLRLISLPHFPWAYPSIGSIAIIYE